MSSDVWAIAENSVVKEATPQSAAMATGSLTGGGRA